MRELVRRLDELFGALGYRTVPQDQRLTVEDAALLSSSEQVIVAGQARSIKAEEITFQPPQFVVIEDGAPETEVSRLVAASKTCKVEPAVVNFSRFVDPLWQASLAAQGAQRDATLAADLDLATGLTEAERPNPNELYVDQSVSTETRTSKPASALMTVEEWLNDGSGMLVILAPAGLGKSELTAVLEWRAALRYFTATDKATFDALPAVAQRVALRELRSLSLCTGPGSLDTSQTLFIMPQPLPWPPGTPLAACDDRAARSATRCCRAPRTPRRRPGAPRSCSTAWSRSPAPSACG